MAATDEQEALLQLAQYQPNASGGLVRDEIFKEMIGPTLMETGGVATPRELREAFKTLWRMDVEVAELDEWVKALEENGTVSKADGRVELTAKSVQDLEKRRTGYEALATEALGEFRASIIVKDPTISDSDLDTLSGDVERLIGLIVARHGAEAAVILYPEEERSEALRGTLRTEAERLPQRGTRLDTLRRDAVAWLFENPTKAQRRYLAARLDHGFFCTVGTIRPEAMPILESQFAGKRIYLDTNVLIPALGLAGRRTNEATRRLLELSQGLGMEIAVTPWTIDEFRHSLKVAQSQITNRGLPGRRFARILREAAQREGGVSLVQGFYEAYEDKGSDPEDWFKRAAQADVRLDELTISIEEAGTTAVEQHSAERVEQYVILLNREAFRRGRLRDDPPLKHDAQLRTLIERLRGGIPAHFRSAQHWVVTEDKVLPRFAQLGLEGEPGPVVPYCMSASAWLQVVRSFTPRTEDFDQTIVDLLASPYLRFGARRNLGEIQAAVARISTLVDDASPAVVGAVVAEENMEAVAAEDGAQDDEYVVEVYKRKEDEVERRFEGVTERVKGLEASVASAETQAEEKAKQASAEQSRSESAETALARTTSEKERIAREKHLNDAEIERLKGSLRESQLENQQTQEFVRRVALVSALALAGCLLIALAIVKVIPDWSGVFFGGASLAAIPYVWAPGSRFAKGATVAIGVAGLLVSFYQLL